MGIVTKIILLLIVTSGIYLAVKINKLLFELAPPPILDEPYWGPGEPTKDDPAIKPFKINIPDKILIDLKDRLNKHREFVKPLEGIQQQYGMNTNLLNEIIEFWKSKYDWKKREQFLNKFPQFKTQVQGLDIHYIHVKPENTKGLKVLPLLLLHGWPGSVREFYEIIPLLSNKREDKDFVFEIIAPSLPGYGFSQGASKPGLGAAEMAVVFKNLMKKLGFNKWYVQGGDWGAIIVSHMAAMFEDKILGLHSNMCFVSNSPLSNLKLFLGSIYPPMIVDKQYEHKVYPLSNLYYTLILETGYMHLQATKPDTIGTALNDSPVGLAAYIIEKFTSFTNPEWKNKSDGGLTIKFKYEDLLDNVMIYWVTSSITTSVRLYSETLNIKQEKLDFVRVPVNVPSACAAFEHELSIHPPAILQDKYKNIVQYNYIEDGGHFAAFEVPKVLADDIFEGIYKMRNTKRD